MRIRVYCSTGLVTRSIVRAKLVAEVEIDRWPADEAAFADKHGGDIIEIAPTDSSTDPGEDHE